MRRVRNDHTDKNFYRFISGLWSILSIQSATDYWELIRGNPFYLVLLLPFVLLGEDGLM